jgi:hypothetical protein
MKALRIGMVDLDTSHPGGFIPILRKLGHEVTAVYDSAAVYEPGYAERFAREHGIRHHCDRLEQMVDLIDAAFIHSCNWDVHIDRARIFVESGKAVFIDKPMAGRVADLHQLAAWGRGGAVVTGGSSLLICDEVAAWHAEHPDPAEYVYALAGCSVDEYNYGIHAYALICGLLGGGVERVRFLGRRDQQRQVELEWKDGRRAVVSVGRTGGYLPFYAALVMQNRVHTIQVNNDKPYESFLTSLLPYLAGEAPPPLAMEQLIEVESAALAGRLSEERGGEPVSLHQLPADYAGYDGAAFARYYKKLKFPQSAE